MGFGWLVVALLFWVGCLYCLVGLNSLGGFIRLVFCLGLVSVSGWLSVWAWLVWLGWSGFLGSWSGLLGLLVLVCWSGLCVLFWACSVWLGLGWAFCSGRVLSGSLSALVVACVVLGVLGVVLWGVRFVVGLSGLVGWSLIGGCGLIYLNYLYSIGLYIRYHFGSINCMLSQINMGGSQLILK